MRYAIVSPYSGKRGENYARVAAEALDYAAKLGWQTIDSAPLDGTPVTTGKIGPLSMGIPRYPVTSRFLGGKWKAKFRKGEWCEYDPQPTHWNPTMPPKT